MYDPGFRNVRFVYIVRTETTDFERECVLTHKNSLELLASNPPKCQSPLLELYYKENQERFLIKKGKQNVFTKIHSRLRLYYPPSS